MERNLGLNISEEQGYIILKDSIKNLNLDIVRLTYNIKESIKRMDEMEVQNKYLKNIN